MADEVVNNILNGGMWVHMPNIYGLLLNNYITSNVEISKTAHRITQEHSVSSCVHTAL